MASSFVTRVLSLTMMMLLIPVIGVAVEARPDPNAPAATDSEKQVDGKVIAPLDRETEAKAHALIQAHLPELKEVLDRLRTDQPRQYGRAIRDLAKSARKLDIAKNRDERLYEIEVDLLQSQNQVNLLTAKLKVRDSQSDRKQLRRAAQRLQQARVARAAYDVDLFRDRLQRTQKQLSTAQDRLEEAQSEPQKKLEQSYLGMLKKAGRQPDK